MTAVMNYARISQAISILNQGSTAYFAIGKKTAWIDEDNPPAEDTTKQVLDEVIGYRKADKFSLCIPLASGATPIYPTVTYGKNVYQLVPQADAYKVKATSIYFETSIASSDFPDGPFREVGLHLGLQSKVAGKLNLLPTEVASTGILWLLTNDILTPRTQSRSVTLSYLLTVKPIVGSAE